MGFYSQCSMGLCFELRPDIRAARERIMKPYGEGQIVKSEAGSLVSGWLAIGATRIPIREVAVHAQALQG